MSFSEVFKSELSNFEILNMRYVDFILQKCHDSDAATKIAIFDAFSNEKYTYAELYNYVGNVAFGLHMRGIKKGDVVSIITSNCPAVVFAQFGILTVGAVMSSITTTNTPEDIGQQLCDSNTLAVMVSEVYLEKVMQAIQLKFVSCVKYLFVIGSAKDSGDANSNNHPFSSTFPMTNTTICEPFGNLLLNKGDVPKFQVDLCNDIIALIYSSGTTDRPKGIMHTNKSFIAYILSIENFVNLGNPVLCNLPLHHISGIAQEGRALKLGCMLITFSKFSIPLFLQIIEKFQISTIFYTSALMVSSWNEINKCNLSSISTVLTGGVDLSKAAELILVNFFCKLCPSARLNQTYGTSETGVITIRLSQNYGSCGKLVQNVQLKFENIANLFSPQLCKKTCIQRSGKIFVKSDTIMKGYFNFEEKTKSVLSKDGWYETGDVGFMDDNNELFVLNRTSELIKHKGKLYFPQDWESVFIAHEAIKEVAIAGKQDSNFGQIPIAFIYPNTNYESNNDTKSSILLFVNKLLPLEMQLDSDSIIFVENPIPKSGIGKILRRVLLQQIS